MSACVQNHEGLISEDRLARPHAQPLLAASGQLQPVMSRSGIKRTCSSSLGLVEMWR